MGQDESDYSSHCFLPAAHENERRHVIERFRLKLKEMVRDKVKCRICYKVFETGKGAAALMECGHIFCLECHNSQVFNSDVRPVPCPFCRAVMRMELYLPLPNPAPRILIGESSVPPSSSLRRSASGLIDTLSDDPAHADAGEDDQPARTDAGEDDPPAPTDAAEDDPPARTDATEDDEPADDDDGNTAD